MGILRTSAMLNGRFQVDPSDCLLLEHLIWDNDEQIPGVKHLVANTIVSKLGVDIPRSIDIDDMETMTFTEPVGKLLSPDGKHYVFSAGGEDVLISKKDYESLTEEISFGDMTVDNKLILTKEHGAFTVRKRKNGSKSYTSTQEMQSARN